ncbi:Endospore coat-associated protein YheD [Sporotomaculum syntrophicum]|uniref:Endospore coat-associated protein YheD n=1 Tax=Sporotomaculum syntrophicum TaxID=182264 RepID=A0A9D3AV99_9FIRM|nr:YheC/YheD family protein [Sporotomaculum syntrophicum]KAF1083815.1 Endospore coat-associated protein YheD [Sporotomaculum syntrophicum]
MDYAKHLIDYLSTNFTLKNHYLVQQKIPLAKIEGNPIDIRVITQWDPDFKDWSVNGKLVKIAQKGYVVTNVARELLLLDEALMRCSIGSAQKIEDKINRACIDISRRLHKNYPAITIIGFDLGVDQKGHIWFIEANLKPDIFMFYRLGDMQMYQKIMKGIKKAKALT